MADQTIGVSKARELMEKSDGKMFTVFFIKKSNGKPREMNARLGVSVGVNGTGRNFKPEDHDLLGVYDMQEHGHRMVSLRSVYRLHLGGKQYKVQA